MMRVILEVATNLHHGSHGVGGGWYMAGLLFPDLYKVRMGCIEQFRTYAL